jgi:hypothetical protein
MKEKEKDAKDTMQGAREEGERTVTAARVSLRSRAVSAMKRTPLYLKWMEFAVFAMPLLKAAAMSLQVLHLSEVEVLAAAAPAASGGGLVQVRRHVYMLAHTP